MADLNKDLQEYLAKNGEKNHTIISLPSISLKTPQWLTRSNGTTETKSTSSWFSSNEESNSCLPNLGRTQRMIGFATCLLLGLLCFVLAGMYAPLILIKARKFALLFTLGSLFTLFSFSFLWGPVNHMKHLFSSERLPFTTVYLVTLLATLYFSLHLQSTLLTVISAISQVIALVWFIVSYIPGGQTGLLFFSKLCTSTVSKSLPI